MLNLIMLNAIMRNVVMLSFVTLSVIILSVVILNAVMLSVVAPPLTTTIVWPEKERKEGRERRRRKKVSTKKFDKKGRTTQKDRQTLMSYKFKKNRLVRAPSIHPNFVENFVNMACRSKVGWHSPSFSRKSCHQGPML